MGIKDIRHNHYYHNTIRHNHYYHNTAIDIRYGVDKDNTTIVIKLRDSYDEHTPR